MGARMSYQPPQMPNGQGGPPQPDPRQLPSMQRVLREAAEAQQQEQNQPSPLFGEVPGEGYLFPHDPETRRKARVETTPDDVRAACLRAIELCADMAGMPYGEQTPEVAGRAALAFAQSYLLLDPSVDQQGVPVGAEAAAQAQASEGLETHKALMQGHVAAHASGQPWSFPVDKSGHPEPPKVKPNPAEEAIQKENEPKEEELKGARGDKPRPRPRIGS